MLKKLSIFVVGLVAMFILVGLGVAVWWKSAVRAPSSINEEKRFVITKGSSIQKIGNNLEEERLIKSATAFKIYVQTKNLANKIPPGEFDLARNLTLSEVVEELMGGPTEIWVTIPEGLRREEIAERFIASLEIEEPEVFRQEFLEATEGREGFLFPDTYLFPRDTTGILAATTLLNTFDKKFPAQGGQGLTLHELVTLASIIERETLTKEERPVVAGIYLKRLENDWTLDADATLQYGWINQRCDEVCDDWWPRPVTQAMKDMNSQYNTYKYGGLPPTPISNPGLTSLEAVANPVKTDYWFYIHDDDGVIHYGRTLEEHNANVQRYLR